MDTCVFIPEIRSDECDEAQSDMEFPLLKWSPLDSAPSPSPWKYQGTHKLVFSDKTGVKLKTFQFLLLNWI